MNTAMAILLSIGISFFMRSLSTVSRYRFLKNKNYKLKEFNFINVLKLFEINNMKDFIKMLIPFYNLYNELDNVVKFELNRDRFVKSLKQNHVIVASYNSDHPNQKHLYNLEKLQQKRIEDKQPYSYFEYQEYSKPKTLVLKNNRNCR